LQASSATSLVFSPDDPSVIYASIDGSGVLRSQDRGASWGDFSNNLGSLLVNALVEQPGRKILFALTDGAGLYRCDLLNISACWQRVGSNLPSAEGQQFLSQPGRPFASRGTFLEAFGAVEPGMLNPSAVPGNSGLLVMTFAPSNPDVAYLGTAGSGVYKSTDGGATWGAVGLSGYNVWGLAVDPVESQIVYAATLTSGSVKMSVDGGSHWGSSSLPGVTVYSLAISSSPARELYAGTDNGVYRLTGGTWLQTGLAGNTVAWLSFHPINSGTLFAGTTNGAFLSADSGGSWAPGPAELAGHTVQSIRIDPLIPSLVYYCTTAHGVLRAGIGN
jgi:hypothetical protein